MTERFFSLVLLYAAIDWCNEDIYVYRLWMKNEEHNHYQLLLTLASGYGVTAMRFR